MNTKKLSLLGLSVALLASTIATTSATATAAWRRSATDAGN